MINVIISVDLNTYIGLKLVVKWQLIKILEIGGNGLKKMLKLGNLQIILLVPIRNKNGDLVATIPEQLDVFHDYYEDLSSDPFGHNLYKLYWSNPDNKELYDYKKSKEWNINQDISIDEINCFGY